MRTLAFLSLAIGLAAIGSGVPVGDARAQQTLEIVPLRHRSVEQVIPVLRPLLEPGGVISGQGYQLILRTSPGNLQELKTTLAAIDTPQRQLQISVRFGDNAERSRSALEARGTLRSGDVKISNRPVPESRNTTGSTVELRATEVRSTLGERVDQQIRVLEGARAFIATGQTRPIRQNTISTGPPDTMIPGNTVFQELATGFEVVPRVSGDRVFLDIQPRRDRPGAYDPASVDTQQVASSVSARLGEWVELGGSAENVARSERGILSTSSAGRSEDRRIWVKVEELQR